MNLLVETTFPDSGVDYAAMQRIWYNSKQYEAKLIKGTEWSETMGSDGTYEVPIITLRFLDPYREYRRRLIDADDQFLQNGQVLLKTDKGTLIGTKKVESWSFPPGEFHIKVSDKIDMKQDVTEKINTTTWSDAATNAIGQVVPRVFNTVIGVEAHKVIKTVNLGDWLLGDTSTTISSVTAVRINDQVVPELAGANWTLGTAGGYPVLNMGHGKWMGKGDSCRVDVTTPAYTPVEIITALVASQVTVGANADFKTWLVNQGYTASNCRFYLNRPMSAAEALKIFCQSFSCGWRTDSSNEVVFTWLNPTSITIDKIFRENLDWGEMPGGCQQVQDYEPREVKNRIKIYYNKDYEKGTYTDFEEYNGANQGDRGIHDDSVEMEYLIETVQANVTVGNRYALNKEPSNMHALSTTWDIGNGVYPGDKIQVQHDNNKTNAPMFGIVRNKRVIPGNNEVALKFEDKDYLYEWRYKLRHDGTLKLDEQGYPKVRS